MFTSRHCSYYSTRCGVSSAWRLNKRHSESNGDRPFQTFLLCQEAIQIDICYSEDKVSTISGVNLFRLISQVGADSNCLRRAYRYCAGVHIVVAAFLHHMSTSSALESNRLKGFQIVLHTNQLVHRFFAIISNTPDDRFRCKKLLEAVWDRNNY